MLLCERAPLHVPLVSHRASFPVFATDYEASLNIRQMGTLGLTLRDTAFPRKAEENVLEIDHLMSLEIVISWTLPFLASAEHDHLA